MEDSRINGFFSSELSSSSKVKAKVAVTAATQLGHDADGRMQTGGEIT